MFDLFGAQSYWIPPQLRQHEEGEEQPDERELPKFHFRPPSAEEFLAWREADRKVRLKEERQREKQLGKLKAILDEKAVRISGTGTPGETITVTLAPWFTGDRELEAVTTKILTEKKKEEEEAVEEVEGSEDDGEQDLTDEATIDPIDQLAEHAEARRVEVKEDGTWEMFYRPLSFVDYVPGIEDFEHHIRLALACITHTEKVGIKVNNDLRELDWTSEDQMKELTKFDDPRREILLRTGSGHHSFHNLVDLAVTLTQGIPAKQKKA